MLFLQFSKKDTGIYEVILKDDRGKDISELKLTDKGQSPFCMLQSKQPVCEVEAIQTAACITFP